MGRRDSTDKEWALTKKKVSERDKNRDRIQFILSASEYICLKRQAGPFLSKIDPAHVIPVSKAYDKCYDPDNIISLNRYSHTNLDSCKHPITGKSITQEEVNSWWIRLLKANPSQWKSFVDKNYIEELENEGE